MKRIHVVYVLTAVLVLEFLLSTMAYNEPSYTIINRESFDVSRITQNQAVNVVNGKWTFNSSNGYLEISMRKALAFERSLYDVGIPVNTPLIGNPTLHARLFVSNLNASYDLIRVFAVLANETHVIETNYFVGRELEEEDPDPNAPTYLYVYTSVSNHSNGWITVDRKIVEDLAAKNISIEADGSWRILKLCVGGMIYQENESTVLSMLVDADQTYLDLEGVKVYPDNASVNMPIILLIAGLFVLSCIAFVGDSVMFQQRNKTEAKTQKGDVFEKVALIFIMQIALLIRLAFLDSVQLASDEAIYTYTSFLITKGVLPYKEVFMAHPPLGFYFTSFFMWIFEPSYPSIRLLSIGIFLGTIVMTYLLSKVVLGKLNGKYSLLVVTFYAFYPSWFIVNSIASSLENLLTLFVLLSTFFYVFYQRNNKKRYLLISGFFGGCTLLITVRAVFFLMSMIIIHLTYAVWIRKPSQFLRNGLLFASGFVLPISCMLESLAASNTLRYFYLDVVTYQLSIFGMSMDDRLWYVGQYLTSQLPLMLLAVFGISLSLRMIKKTRNISEAIPGFVFFLNLFLFSSYGFLMHYLQFLCPFLSIISILGAIEIKRVLEDTHMRGRVFVCIFIVLLSCFCYFATTHLYQVSFYFQKNPYDKVNYYVGKRIANITSPSDYIWSSDAAIGFFAQRMIVAPSADFRFIGCSDSIIGFDYGKDRGAEMKSYNDGFVTAEDFVQSWESKHVKVLVFIMKRGWVPYVDPLLWNGYRGHIGVAEYVSSKYKLLEVVFGEDVPQIYYIWVRLE